MEDYRLLITDLTDYGDLRCVAGWDIDREIMVRPEPSPGGFWPNNRTGHNQPFVPRNIVTFSANLPNPPTLYPHLNEDRVVTGAVTLVQQLTDQEFTALLSSIPSGPANQGFDQPLEFANGKAYIKTGTRYPSLQAIRTKASALHFFESNFDGKRRPRCRITVGRRSVNASIAATDIREMFRRGSIAEVSKKYAGADELHIQLGLARGFGNYPDRCYLQVNGIYKP